MIYAVVWLEDAPANATEKIREIDDTAYLGYAPKMHLVSYKGTPSSLSNLLELEESDPAVLITQVSKYFGLANKDMWNWMVEHG